MDLYYTSRSILYIRIYTIHPNIYIQIYTVHPDLYTSGSLHPDLYYTSEYIHPDLYRTSRSIPYIQIYIHPDLYIRIYSIHPDLYYTSGSIYIIYIRIHTIHPDLYCTSGSILYIRGRMYRNNILYIQMYSIHPQYLLILYSFYILFTKRVPHIGQGLNLIVSCSSGLYFKKILKTSFSPKNFDQEGDQKHKINFARYKCMCKLNFCKLCKGISLISLIICMAFCYSIASREMHFAHGFHAICSEIHDIFKVSFHETLHAYSSWCMCCTTE